MRDQDRRASVWVCSESCSRTKDIKTSVKWDNDKGFRGKVFLRLAGRERGGGRWRQSSRKIRDNSRDWGLFLPLGPLYLDVGCKDKQKVGKLANKGPKITEKKEKKPSRSKFVSRNRENGRCQNLESVNLIPWSHSHPASGTKLTKKKLSTLNFVTLKRHLSRFSSSSHSMDNDGGVRLNFYCSFFAVK